MESGSSVVYAMITMILGSPVSVQEESGPEDDGVALQATHSLGEQSRSAQGSVHTFLSLSDESPHSPCKMPCLSTVEEDQGGADHPAEVPSVTSFTRRNGFIFTALEPDALACKRDLSSGEEDVGAESPSSSALQGGAMKWCLQSPQNLLQRHYIGEQIRYKFGSGDQEEDPDQKETIPADKDQHIRQWMKQCALSP